MEWDASPSTPSFAATPAARGSAVARGDEGTASGADRTRAGDLATERRWNGADRTPLARSALVSTPAAEQSRAWWRQTSGKLRPQFSVNLSDFTKRGKWGQRSPDTEEDIGR